MPLSEREGSWVGKAPVCEVHARPIIKGSVAALASSREFCGDVIGTGRPLEIRQMARFASGR
jgi:hypothetical protein